MLWPPDDDMFARSRSRALSTLAEEEEAMMTVEASDWRAATATPKPIPEEPPMIRIV
jgi:hypothetical protein